jgi:hypothetical protein
MKLSIDQVFDKIRDERIHQNLISAKYDHKGNPSVEAEILMMEQYLSNAREAWVTGIGNDAALDMLRKVTGIAVRCFENHGCPSRYIPPEAKSTNPDVIIFRDGSKYNCENSGCGICLSK